MPLEITEAMALFEGQPIRPIFYPMLCVAVSSMGYVGHDNDSEHSLFCNPRNSGPHLCLDVTSQ